MHLTRLCGSNACIILIQDFQVNINKPLLMEFYSAVLILLGSRAAGIFVLTPTYHSSE